MQDFLKEFADGSRLLAGEIKPGQRVRVDLRNGRGVGNRRPRLTSIIVRR